ncbi:hypothetical protein F4805DRAFT_437052 [Annulohypoxylon moriforme]|nr:hypothetical protein F4805DRAFT_437052 [Annulohypoxylon moriforme]
MQALFSRHRFLNRSTMSLEENTPFLGIVSKNERTENSDLSALTKSRRQILRLSLVANAVLSVLCALLSGRLIQISAFGSNRANGQNITHEDIAEPYSPANTIIRYEHRSMVANDTRFTGYPGARWEQSMHELLEGTLIRVSDDELKLHGSESIALKDGGYAAGLGVAHNLHCVKKIKQWLYHEYFYPNLEPGGEEFENLRFHADHCLDFIRQSIMCRLDFSMYTLAWGDGERGLSGHLYHHTPEVQKCVDWDKVHTWMLGRSTSIDNLVAR